MSKNKIIKDKLLQIYEDRLDLLDLILNDINTPLGKVDIINWLEETTSLINEVKSKTTGLNEWDKQHYKELKLFEV
jgi:hypothetical protein